jgi:hypothetical protein
MWFLTNFGGVGEKGQWLWNKRFKLETFDEYRRMFDESLDYNLRAVWPYPSWETETGKFVDDSFLHYYLPMKSVREARWRAGEWKPIQDRE